MKRHDRSLIWTALGKPRAYGSLNSAMGGNDSG